MKLLRVVAPHFVAGALVNDQTGVVVEAAPILRYTIGWTGRNLRAYACRKGWSASYVET